VQAKLPIGYTFNNFNFTYDPVGNLTALRNTAQPPLYVTPARCRQQTGAIARPPPLSPPHKGGEEFAMLVNRICDAVGIGG
jgi:hypothetical protein